MKFTNNNAGREAMQSDVTARQHNWVPIKKHQALFGLQKNKQQRSVKKTQFPLISSWACTVHKVQDLSLTEVVVSFDFAKQKSFNREQIYVALSKILSMNKMYLIGSYNKTALKVGESVKKEYDRLRSEGLFKSQSHLGVTETSITITLLNSCSFKLHVLDIATDHCLLDNDMLCLTETQCEAGSDTLIIESALQNNIPCILTTGIINSKAMLILCQMT